MNEKNTLDEIIVPRGIISQISAQFGVCYATVKKALSGHVSSPKHIEIRKYALAVGGCYASTAQ